VKKVLVAEIGQFALSLTAFGDLDTESPLLLGQEITNLGLEKGLSLLEEDIGVSDTEFLECYIVSSLKQEELQRVIKALDHAGKANPGMPFTGKSSHQEGIIERWSEAKIVRTNEAMKNLSSLFLEEVGEVLILEGDNDSIDLYLIQKNNPLFVEGSSEASQEGRAQGNLTLKTAEELAFEMEDTAQTLQKAILHFCTQGSPDSRPTHTTRDLTQLRWVIGTGSAITTLPGGLEVIRESLRHCSQMSFPETGFPILIDRDNILTPLGALSDTYRQGAWQLLLESLGIEG